jgi:hypothetical protein
VYAISSRCFAICRALCTKLARIVVLVEFGSRAPEVLEFNGGGKLEGFGINAFVKVAHAQVR